jgi:hypothetical protein
MSSSLSSLLPHHQLRAYGTALEFLRAVQDAVGDRPIPRPIGEDRGGVISAVHCSPVRIWAVGAGTA